MWRNADVLDFVGWLRDHDDRAPDKVGFYGVDLYSLYSSMAAVIEYLDNVDPEAARRARYRYGCFEHAGEDPQSYGYAASFGLTPTCESEVVQQLVEIRRNYAGSDDAFYAEQNARLVRNAERYYRSMFTGRVSSWNLRDQHMAETIETLAKHVPRAKIVVWEHNSHLGDARATRMGREGELNVGQLMRQKHGDDVRLIGFTTYHGTVTAASEWDGPAEHKRVRPGMPGSYEALLHGAGIADFLLPLRGNAAARALEEERLERAIGVIYMPATERISHYFEASLARQFDAVIHIDETRAVEPLERFEREHTREAPETYPSAL
jgi:erythromycin esterase-like protein